MNPDCHVLIILLLIVQMCRPAVSGSVLAEAGQPPAPIAVPGRAEADDLSPHYAYSLDDSHAVDGCQGIAWEGSC